MCRTIPDFGLTKPLPNESKIELMRLTALQSLSTTERQICQADRLLVPLYEEHGVDLVLVGHHHAYLRSWPLSGDHLDLENGITYVQLGGGGGNLSVAGYTPDPRDAKSYVGYNYAMISVSAASLTFAMRDIEGRLRDRFELHRTRSNSNP